MKNGFNQFKLEMADFRNQITKLQQNTVIEAEKVISHFTKQKSSNKPSYTEIDSELKKELKKSIKINSKIENFEKELSSLKTTLFNQLDYMFKNLTKQFENDLQENSHELKSEIESFKNNHNYIHQIVAKEISKFPISKSIPAQSNLYPLNKNFE